VVQFVPGHAPDPTEEDDRPTANLTLNPPEWSRYTFFS
jgi:hypothetical protein